MVRLEIHDDGVGFNPDNYTEGHGLQNIKDRVQALLGRFELSSSESGAVLVITLPV